MPSHSVIRPPIPSRLPPGRVRSAGLNFKQRLSKIFHHSHDGEFNERNDRRIWNDNISGVSGLLPQLIPPPPPKILDWNTPFRRREMSPHTEAFMDFSDLPPRVCESEYNNDSHVGPERFPPNDFHHSMEQPVMVRDCQELSNLPPRDSISSVGYHSFEGHPEDFNFRDSSSSFDYRKGMSTRDDRWEIFEPPIQVANKRRREPSPRGRVGPSAVLEMSEKVFHIGGYKLPYVTNGVAPLPQPEGKSFLARFFKKNPNYSISMKKAKDRSAVSHVYVESVDVTEFEDGRGKRLTIHRFREDVANELIKVYRARMYRKWDGWWKDFHSINLDIDEELGKFEDFNVKYNFMPPNTTFNFIDLINRAEVALTKNRNNYLGNMRVIYGLMNHTLLGNMPLEIVAKLQDLIRSVPNHLWIYKLRCMVFLWYNYKQVMKNHTNDIKYQHVVKEWNSPVIHWMAKQAFNELRIISQVEFPDYLKLFGKPKKSTA
ncbi:hypothetical protein KR038_007492 [Drosophila bunnanda]|nr:hypothetical protein KR038_007492 [Drosophila bunnanda]